MPTLDEIRTFIKDLGVFDTLSLSLPKNCPVVVAEDISVFKECPVRKLITHRDVPGEGVNEGYFNCAICAAFPK